MKRFEERQELIRQEVQDVRGLPWRPAGEASGELAPAAPAVVTNGGREQTNGGGAHGADEEDEGVFL